MPGGNIQELRSQTEGKEIHVWLDGYWNLAWLPIYLKMVHNVDVDTEHEHENPH
jgi:hypothetical protein